MINFYSENNFSLEQSQEIQTWIGTAITQLGYSEGSISYIFCNDAYLLDLNKQYLNHDTLTDIISFDYTDNDTISGDIFISIDRVKDNAKDFNVSFTDELHRVLIHGVLHFAGFNDKTDEEQKEMTKQEDKFLSLREF